MAEKPKGAVGDNPKRIDVVFPKNWGDNPKVLKAWRKLKEDGQKSKGGS